MFNIGDYVMLNQNVEKGLPGKSGEVVQIVRKIKSANYNYEVDLGNAINPVKESEISKLTDEQRELIKYIYRWNKVIYSPTNEEVTIVKVDFINNQVEIGYDTGGTQVVDINKIRKIEDKVDCSNEEGDLGKTLDVFFGHYKSENDTYTLPKQLLINLLKQTLEME